VIATVGGVAVAIDLVGRLEIGRTETRRCHRRRCAWRDPRTGFAGEHPRVAVEATLRADRLRRQLVPIERRGLVGRGWIADAAILDGA
jgi:hypothetical protein